MMKKRTGGSVMWCYVVRYGVCSICRGEHRRPGN